MTTVLLIRHGRTSANTSGTLAGRTPGVTLDATGRRQARSLATRLRDLPLNAIVHSPLERCRDTAGAILAEQSGASMHADERLIECDYGRWTGRALADLAEDDLWPVIQQTPSVVTFPDGEALSAMADRAAAAVADWIGRHPDGTLAMVSHGDVIKAILSRALGQPFDQFQRIVVGPGSLSVIRHGDPGSAVLRMNDTGRSLAGLAGAGRPTVGGGTG